MKINNFWYNAGLIVVLSVICLGIVRVVIRKDKKDERYRDSV